MVFAALGDPLSRGLARFDSRALGTYVRVMYVSPFDSSGTPGVFYTYFYNHLIVSALKNYYIWSFLEVPTGF